jgi:hypothetical protein
MLILIVHPVQAGEPLKVKKSKIRVTRKPDLPDPKKSTPIFIFHRTLSNPHSHGSDAFWLLDVF